MERGNDRDEGLFATLYYFIFIPSYAFLAYHAIIMIYGAIVSLFDDLDEPRRIVQIIVLTVAPYYPVVFSLFIIWAIKYGARIKIKRNTAGCLWILGGVLFFIFVFTVLMIIFSYW